MAQGVSGECLLMQELQVMFLLRLPSSLLGSAGIEAVDKHHCHPSCPQDNVDTRVCRAWTLAKSLSSFPRPTEPHWTTLLLFIVN